MHTRGWTSFALVGIVGCVLTMAGCGAQPQQADLKKGDSAAPDSATATPSEQAQATPVEPSPAESAAADASPAVTASEKPTMARPRSRASTAARPKPEPKPEPSAGIEINVDSNRDPLASESLTPQFMIAPSESASLPAEPLLDAPPDDAALRATATADDRSLRATAPAEDVSPPAAAMPAPAATAPRSLLSGGSAATAALRAAVPTDDQSLRAAAPAEDASPPPAATPTPRALLSGGSGGSATALPKMAAETAPAPAATAPMPAPTAPPTEGPTVEPKAAPEATAAEIAPEPTAPATTETAAAAADADSADYTKMTVFYGTDRLPITNASPTAASYVLWVGGTAVCASLALVLGIMVVRLRRGWLSTAGLALGTLVMVGLTLAAVLQVPTAPANPALARVYGNERGEMEMGTCDISIPKTHQVGEVERPSILKLEFQEDPTKHVVIMDVTPESDEAFFTKLRTRVDDSPTKEAFVFVHGFNVTFEAAARRTAQLAYDLKFDGAPIFYSWPSQGGLLQYTVDETNVAWTVPHLKDFLIGVAERSGAKSVHLIAHSMGNRALTAALQSLTYEMKQRAEPMFRQVVLTAPDIDADIFRRDIAPAITQIADRVTLYASSNDEALVLSKQVHGYPRAGDSGEGMLVIPGIDTVDVTSVDTSLLGHSYYGSNHSVLEDLWDLLHESKPPAQRNWLRSAKIGQLVYWVFVTEQARLHSAAAGTTDRQ